ncbi:tocopherol cyclase family protein [Neolewinella persica]|uniref:tocopherol cyclase family protein n=1 Tax=Neolewinella persica TaxID=70998 RepID=UPI0003698A63|nr:tocopherol cyclase family protein [Neolewinella persica]
MKNFLLRRRATLDPPRFQGWGRTRNYFEGWYFKLVLPEKSLAYSFIPGISYAADGTGHAFLQVLDGVGVTSAYHQYDVTDFQPAEEHFELQLGPHFFSEDSIRIDLPDLQFDLNFKDIHPWQKRPLAPGVMGWYGFVPRMQCYHGLVSLYHELQGKITVAGTDYDASGGIGYIEKDWGSGFPDAWVWCQSNHLTGTVQPASLMASVASIPWLGSSFTGFLATFLFEGELHLFTTWAGSQVQTTFDEEQGTVTLHFSSLKAQLIVTGHPAPGGDLASPITGSAMTGKINESLQAELEVEFWRNEQVVYAGRATWAGLEVSEGAKEVL